MTNKQRCLEHDLMKIMDKKSADFIKFTIGSYLKEHPEAKREDFKDMEPPEPTDPCDQCSHRLYQVSGGSCRDLKYKEVF